jgi:hypothetical protein
VLQGANLVWLNGTQDRQEVVPAAFDKQNPLKSQKPLSLAPIACSVQRSVYQGSYTYMLRSSGAKFSLYAA